MRKRFNYRLIGSLGTFKLQAHSSLDAGARWKSDKEFYAIGELIEIEDIDSGQITRAKKERKKQATRDKVLAKELRPHFAFSLRAQTAS
jgi:hypothetical protein